jgi:hypothetical protein
MREIKFRAWDTKKRALKLKKNEKPPEKEIKVENPKE